MGSAEIQGPLWGRRAQDWAEVQEQTVLPLFGAVLDAAHATTRTQLLDAGCGSGLPTLLAKLRGAEVSGIDASSSLIEIAKDRMSDADLQQGELEELPFADAAFDAVIAINSVFYAANPQTALGELVRVARHGGHVVVTTWGMPEQCEYGAFMQQLGSLLPPPPPDAPPGGPFAFSQPGAVEALFTNAGLDVSGRGDVSCPFVYPNADVAWRGQVGSGVIQRAIAHSGEAAVRKMFSDVSRDYTRSDGSIRYDNTFAWVAGVRP